MCEILPEIMTVMEVSAKDNTNVDTTFAQLATELKVRNLCLILISFSIFHLLSNRSN